MKLSNGDKHEIRRASQTQAQANVTPGIVAELGYLGADFTVKGCRKDSRLELTGCFRPKKQWDMPVVHSGHLVAGQES